MYFKFHVLQYGTLNNFKQNYKEDTLTGSVDSVAAPLGDRRLEMKSMSNGFIHACL